MEQNVPSIELKRPANLSRDDERFEQQATDNCPYCVFFGCGDV